MTDANTDRQTWVSARLLPGETVLWSHVAERFYAPKEPKFSATTVKVLSWIARIFYIAVIVWIISRNPAQDLTFTLISVAMNTAMFFIIISVIRRAGVTQKLFAFSGPDEYHNAIVTDTRIMLFNEEDAITAIAADDVSNAAEDFQGGQKALRINIKDGSAKVIVAAINFTPAAAAIRAHLITRDRL